MQSWGTSPGCRGTVDSCPAARECAGGTDRRKPVAASRNVAPECAGCYRRTARRVAIVAWRQVSRLTASAARRGSDRVIRRRVRSQSHHKVKRSSRNADAEGLIAAGFASETKPRADARRLGWHRGDHCATSQENGGHTSCLAGLPGESFTGPPRGADRYYWPIPHPPNPPV